MSETPTKIAEKILGRQGKMISGSKGAYHAFYPLNVPVFNANVVMDTGLGPYKIWHGDIDLTLEEDKIVKLAKKLDAVVYVLREMDGRFDNENSPLVDNAVYKVDQLGNRVYQHYYERFKYVPPKAPVKDGSLVNANVMKEWEFNLEIKEPEPTHEQIMAQIANAKKYHKESDHIKIEMPEDPPDFSSFLENCSYEVSPFVRFRAWIKEHFGIDDHDTLFKIKLINYDYDQLISAQKAWERVLGDSSFALSTRDPRYWGPDYFYGAPSGYSADPDWVEEGCLYIRR